VTRVLLEDHTPQTLDPRAATPSAPPAPSVPRRLLRASSRLAPVRRSRLLFNLVTIAVTLVFSYIALSEINLAEVWSALRSCDYWWLVPALGAFGLGNFARALRWRSLFAPGRRPPRGTTMNAMMIGYFYNNILPARAGEAARTVVLTRRSSAPPVEIVGTVVLERLYDVLAILAVFFLAEPWLPHVSWFGKAAIAAIALATVLAGAATVLAVYGDRPLRLLLSPLRRFSSFSAERLERTVADLAHGLAGLRNRNVAVEAFLWTGAAWMASALCAYLVSLAFHLNLPFASGVLVTVAIGFGMILPSPPAALGVFEGAVVIALGAYGLSKSAALPYALVLHAVNFIPFVIIGLGLLQYNARHPVHSRRPQTEAAPAVA